MKYTTPTAEHYPHSTDNTRLSEPHRRMLVEESGIDEAIVEERGYYTTRHTSEIPEAFKGWLRRLGLVVTMYSPDGVTTLPQLRANKPWTNKRGKELRYMTPAHAETIIDVHPRNMEKVGDPSEPLWITEGVKKGDALTTQGQCAISLPGVWNFGVRGTHGKELKECWDHVALQGRDVIVVYDSDVMDKDEVKQALQQLVTALEGRGASVRVVYLPDAPGGSKQGVDDYLVAGGTVDDMYNMARPFEPSDYTRERLSRDDELRATTEALEAAWRNHEWVAKGKPRASRRKVWRAYIDEARRSGEQVDGTLQVTFSELQVAERTGVSRVTAHKAIVGLEEEEGALLRNSREGKAIHEANTYTLLVPSSSDSVTQLYNHGSDSYSVGDSYSSCSREGTLPSPDHVALHSCIAVSRNEGDEVTQAAALEELKRLRWGYTMATRTDEGYDYQYVDRLGSIAGEAFEILLLELSGDAHAKTVSKAMGREESPSRFIERVGSKLENAGMVRITEDQRLIVLPSWPANLGLAREMGGEYEAEKLTKERHERQREAFRLALRQPARPPHKPSEEVPVEEPDGYIEDLERVEEEVEPVVEIPVEVEPVVEEEVEPEDEALHHHLACECIDCSIPAPKYAIPYARAA